MSRSYWRARAYSMTYGAYFLFRALAVPLVAWMHASSGFGQLFVLFAVLAAMIFARALSLPREADITDASQV